MTIPTYQKDGRLPLSQIYSALRKLDNTVWARKTICKQHVRIGSCNEQLPIYGFMTKNKGAALWLIAGIHGEEPAGSNAIVKNIEWLSSLGKRRPIVVLPLCNPSGYRRDWRYPKAKKIYPNKVMKSVGDADHVLEDVNNPCTSRQKKAICSEAVAIAGFVLSVSKTHKPQLVIDLHEDKYCDKAYVYSQGRLGARDRVARKIVSIINQHDMPLMQCGATCFAEMISNGIIEKVRDGSLDELLASDQIIVNGNIERGPGAKTVVVVETSVESFSLTQRIACHSDIILSVAQLYDLSLRAET